MEVLFESRLEIENIAGKLRAIQSQPQYHPEVVVPRDTFVDRAGTSIWGTVLKDGGRYRMWYQPWPEDWDGRDVSLVGYAESDDGLSWEKKPLGLVDYGPTPNHLCDLGLHGAHHVVLTGTAWVFGVIIFLVPDPLPQRWACGRCWF